MKATASRRKAAREPIPSVIFEDDPAPGADDRLEKIAVAAYYKAEARGFMPGQEMDDWLEAEAEIDETDGSEA